MSANIDTSNKNDIDENTSIFDWALAQSQTLNDPTKILDKTENLKDMTDALINAFSSFNPTSFNPSFNPSLFESNGLNFSTELIKQQVKLLSANAIVPTKGSKYSACWDLYSPIDCIIPHGENKLIKTDVAIAWNFKDYYMQLLSRSGLAYKNNVVVQAGVIDYDYRQNIGVLLQNNSSTDFSVKKGDRIAQYTFVKIKVNDDITIVEEFSPLDSDRIGGFGSTGK